MKQLSTTALSKKQGTSAKELFDQLEALGLIEKEADTWKLTTKGQQQGGVYKKGQYGEYIAWPEDLDIDQIAKSENLASMVISKVAEIIGVSPKTPVNLVTATTIGQYFELPAHKINFILSELGWISRKAKGWELTKQGKKQAGVQEEDAKSGIPYVRWPETLINSKILQDTINQLKGDEKEVPNLPNQDTQDVGFREKFEAKHRCADGHFVRSKAEMLIDNWLYMAEIIHAYERRLPIEEDVYSDFYIPTGKVYIEYWGYEDDPKYLTRKQKKLELYEKYGFNLIELCDKEIQNLDDILPQLLLKYGVQAY